ncbi:MAG: DNA repair protein RecO [Phycisphaerales bacterium]|jgi:DNA repair protein RecO (recombination protein O)|nr:DNA repair protein RecO [Phycisphaerales bacterium]
MPLVHDRCICLRKFEYSETSQILTLFSREHGLLRAMAKGAHRRTKAGASKFDGGVDLLDIGQAVFTHDPARELSTLTEWSLREGHLELRKCLRGMYLGQYAAELMGFLVEEHDPHPDLFVAMEKCLAELSTSRREEAFLGFELELLRQAGYLAELSMCVLCHNELSDRGPASFSPARGGIVCRSCLPKVAQTMPFDLRLLRLVQGLLKLPRVDGAIQRLPRLSRHQTDPINRLILSHIEHTLGRRMRMSAYIFDKR